MDCIDFEAKLCVLFKFSISFDQFSGFYVIKPSILWQYFTDKIRNLCILYETITHISYSENKYVNHDAKKNGNLYLNLFPQVFMVSHTVMETQQKPWHTGIHLM